MSTEPEATARKWQTISDGYRDYMFDLWKIRLAIIIINCLTGAVAIVLNGYIVGIFWLSKAFRKLEFYPLMFNSLVDFWGTGLLVVIHNVMVLGTLRNYETMEFVFEGDLLSDWRRIVQSTAGKCSFLALRTTFSQYTTGPCTFLLAVDRYIAVCWASRSQRIMSFKTRMILCSILTGSQLLIFTASLLRVKLNYDRGVVSCDSSMYRDIGRRNAFDSLFFFLIPAFVCLVLYSMVGRTLFKSKNTKMKSRNRSLTTAFLFSLIFWIVCWTPETLYLLYEKVVLKEDVMLYFQQSYTYYVAVTMRTTVFLCNSYVSPLLILFISRRFQEPFKKMWTRWKLKLGLKVNDRRSVPLNQHTSSQVKSDRATSSVDCR